MQPVPYLFFQGTCAEAMRFYASVFGGKPEIMDFSAAPREVLDQMPGTPPDAVMHAALKIGDGWMDMGRGPMQVMSTRSLDELDWEGCDVEKAKEVFDQLGEGGEERMPFEPTFFSPGFGTLTDRYGTRWMVMADGPEG